MPDVAALQIEQAVTRMLASTDFPELPKPWKLETSLWSPADNRSPRTRRLVIRTFYLLAEPVGLPSPHLRFLAGTSPTAWQTCRSTRVCRPVSR